LRGGVSSEVTDTRGTIINLISQLGGTDLPLSSSSITKLPVLAEEAIEGAGLIKDCQVFIAIFRPLTVAEIRVSLPCPPRANPASYTVGGEGIIIPTHVSLIGSDTPQLVAFIKAQPAIAYPSLRDAAFI
jgi:hypothetical protein